jgi:hypothetical protein
MVYRIRVNKSEVSLGEEGYYRNLTSKLMRVIAVVDYIHKYNAHSIGFGPTVTQYFNITDFVYIIFGPKN